MMDAVGFFGGIAPLYHWQKVFGRDWKSRPAGEEKSTGSVRKHYFTLFVFDGDRGNRAGAGGIQDCFRIVFATALENYRFCLVIQFKCFWRDTDTGTGADTYVGIYLDRPPIRERYRSVRFRCIFYVRHIVFFIDYFFQGRAVRFRARGGRNGCERGRRNRLRGV